MEGDNRPPAQGEPPSSDWRSQIYPTARQLILQKIMDTLKRHLPAAVPVGMTELNKLAVQFEERVFTTAVDQADYLRRISMKILSVESKSKQNTPMNPQSDVNQNSTNTGSLGITPQVNKQGQSLPQIPTAGQPSGRQQPLAQNPQDNSSASFQGPSSLSASPSIADLSQSTLPNFNHTSNMQNMPGISHNSVSNSLAQGTTPDIYVIAQRQIQGRQQQQSIVSQQQQQSIVSQQQQQSQNPLLYQNQLQPQKIQSNALLQPSMRQQQQQSLLQANLLQPSQQSVLQMPSDLPSGQSSIQQSPATAIQSALTPQSARQQIQQNSIQQSVTSLRPQLLQTISRQSQEPPSSSHQQTSLQQQSAAIHQQSNLQIQQQQQQLIGQQEIMPNMSSIQQNPMLGQQNNIVCKKQQQQQRLPAQQNNLVNMQQSQQLLKQQMLSLHPQQLGQQTNMQGLQQQQQPQSHLRHQQQPQLLGSRQNVSNTRSLQSSIQLLQQSKNMSQTQQQLQQPSISLLQPQGQQSHNMSSQQQLISQFQSQQGQLQQTLAMQQQPNAIQREIHQRLQASGALLHCQSAREQQKQFMQSQSGIPDVSSSTSIDSTSQTGHDGTDWQEEVYQKIQALKEAHFVKLQEFHLKVSLKFQQIEMIPLAKQSENFEKLKSLKMFLEHMIAFLQISKNNVTIVLKEKFPLYEKQIIGLLTSYRRQKVMPSLQQGQRQFQLSSGHAQNTPQHQPFQVLQMQRHENHGNQVQQVNMQGSITTMQSTVSSSLQHGSMTLPSLAAPAKHQNESNSVQSASDWDPVQVNSFGSLQQGSMGSVQKSVEPLQNSVSAAQQTNLYNSSQCSISALKPNEASMQNSNVLQKLHLKQQQKEHLMQNQQLKQQLPQPQIQQQQRQLLLQQHLHQQQKQQQPSQLLVNQMSQLHPMNELNELKARQGSSDKPGIYQQPYTGGQRHNYHNQQLKPCASFPIKSPQNLQASSPQISHHSSPQIDQQASSPTLTKAGTPMQSTGSPFVVPSPSTPIAMSSIPGDSEKVASAAVSLPTTGQTTLQLAASPQPQAPLLAVVTPGISASPLLAEFMSQESILPNITTTTGASASDRPVEQLIKTVQSLSPKALSSAVSGISSVISMIDQIAGSAPGNGSRAAVGEDLVATTKCRLQSRNLVSQDGGATMKKRKRLASAMPLNNGSSAGSIIDNFMKFRCLDSSELESTGTCVKRQKLEVNHALHDEIREINQQLIDTVVSICDEDSDSVAAKSEGSREGTIVKCSFNAVAFSPSLKAHFASMHMSPIAPLRLLVPSSYPKCSPLLLDKLPTEPSKEFEDLSSKANSRFSLSLRGLSQPTSLREMARTWDACARKVIVEYARQAGGGTFSSTYGAWENCVGA